MYVPAEVDETRVEQRIFEQAHRIQSGGAVSGWAALRWRGANYFDGLTAQGEPRPVRLVVGNHPLQPDPRVHIDRARIAQTERVCTGGIWITTVQRALFDEMRYADSFREAVVMMDMAAAARLISVELFSMYVAQRQAWTGVPLVRRALRFAINESRSPQESRMRLVWEVDAGLERPLSNVPLFSLEGRFLGIPDIFDPVAGVVGEYSGVDHKSRDRHRSDVEREHVLREHGLEYFEVVGGDLTDRQHVVHRMLETRARARFDSLERRQWTLDPPAWWRPREEPLEVHLVRLGLAPYLVRI